MAEVDKKRGNASFSKILQQAEDRNPLNTFGSPPLQDIHSHFPNVMFHPLVALITFSSCSFLPRIHLHMLSFVFIVGYVSANTGCEAGWAYFNGNCYKHIVDNSRVIYEEAFYECAARNSVIWGVESPEELNFLKGEVFR